MTLSFPGNPKTQTNEYQPTAAAQKPAFQAVTQNQPQPEHQTTAAMQMTFSAHTNTSTAVYAASMEDLRKKEGIPKNAFFELDEKPLRAFPPVFLQSAARIICTPLAYKFHTCSLRCIFRQVHALTENVPDFVFRLREKFCEAFLTV